MLGIARSWAQNFSAEDAENGMVSLRPPRKLPGLSATVFEPQRHREHRGGNTRLRPGANDSRCAILVREQRKSRRMPAEFQIWLTAFPLLPDENGGRRRPRAGFGIPVYLCVLCASVVHYYQFLISMNDDEAVAGVLR